MTRDERNEGKRVRRQEQNKRTCLECGSLFSRIEGGHMSMRWCEKCVLITLNCLSCKGEYQMRRDVYSYRGGRFCSKQCTYKGIIQLVPRGKTCHLYKDGRTKDRASYIKKHRAENLDKYSQYTNTRRTKKIGNGGEHTLEQWQELKRKYNNMCLCCKKQEPFVRLTRDHIIPVSCGGPDDISNIQPLCLSCNSRKNTKIINYIEICETTASM